MFSKATKKRVVQATVSLLPRGGQGVLIPGGFVLTAAHCINWTCDGQMAMFGLEVHQTIKTSTGREVTVSVCAVEPVSDIAVLAGVDGKDEDSVRAEAAFLEFCDDTEPVAVCSEDSEAGKPFRVHILSHKGTWIDGNARLVRPGFKNLVIETARKVEGGTSGSPVVDDRGLLVGVVSRSTEKKGATGKFICNVPRPHLAMPVWAWSIIDKAARSRKRLREVGKGRIVIPPL